MASLSLQVILFFILLGGQAQQGSSQPPCAAGSFCPAEYAVGIPATCGVFLNNKTQSPTTPPPPPGNYTWTNASNATNNTWTLEDTLIDQSIDLSSIYNLGFVDASSTCQSSAVKTELETEQSSLCGTTPDFDSFIPILAEKLQYIHYGRTSDNPATSCLAILQHNSSSQSDMYWITSPNGPIPVYCDMDGSNCDSHGGWMRVVKVDLNVSNDCIGSAFEVFVFNGKKVCRRVQFQGGCVSAYIETKGQNYSRVCGKIRGYQHGTTDSFGRSNAVNLSPDANYVDGISITHGTNPRKHIFTYASGCSESGSCWSSSECPCQTGATSVFPKFLGYNDFYCESGSYWHPGGGTFYTEPLWDGKNCDWKEAPCCTSSRLPWFYQALPTATSHNIEFRVCSAGNKNNEDIAFDQAEFYIK